MLILSRDECPRYDLRLNFLFDPFMLLPSLTKNETEKAMPLRKDVSNQMPRALWRAFCLQYGRGDLTEEGQSNGKRNLYLPIMAHSPVNVTSRDTDGNPNQPK